MSEAAIVLSQPKSQQIVSADDFMPILTVEQAVQRKVMINQFIEGVLREDVDYGIIPGGQQKPVLLKPGAEKLCSIFGLAPRYIDDCIVEDWTGEDHLGETFLFYRVRCQLWRGDRMMGEAIGSCNSWEQKYRWRDSKRVCPQCNVDAIIPGKAEYGGGWLCFKRKGGCGAKFLIDDPAIATQSVGRVPNPDVADQANTILKMAQKRALVSAALVVTNCSDAFTPDLEDFAPDTGGHPVGTQAAQDHVRDRKLAEARNEPLPAHPTLQAMLDAVVKSGNVKLTFDVMRRQLVEAMPESGEKEYKAILDKFNIKAGSKTVDLQNCLTEMWNMLTMARDAANSQQPLIDEDEPF